LSLKLKVGAVAVEGAKIEAVLELAAEANALAPPKLNPTGRLLSGLADAGAKLPKPRLPVGLTGVDGALEVSVGVGPNADVGVDVVAPPKDGVPNDFDPKAGVIVDETGEDRPKAGAVVDEIVEGVPKTGAADEIAEGVPKTGAVVEEIGVVLPKAGAAVDVIGVVLLNAGATVDVIGVVAPKAGAVVEENGVELPNTGAVEAPKAEAVVAAEPKGDGVTAVVFPEAAANDANPPPDLAESPRPANPVEPKDGWPKPPLAAAPNFDAAPNVDV
jgi:hypothetical protein